MGPESETGRKSYLYVIIAIVYLTQIIIGFIMAWTSPVLPKLESNDTENPLAHSISIHEKSTLAALSPFGSLMTLSPLLAGLCIEKIGKSDTIALGLIPAGIGYFLTSAIQNIWAYYVMRFLCGITISFIYTAAPMYVAEISETNIRGRLTASLNLFQKCGFLISFSLAPYISIPIFSTICATFIFGVFLLSNLFPRSPYDLVKNGENMKAEDVLQRLRKTSAHEIETEMAIIMKSTDYQTVTFKEMIKSRLIRKCFYISAILSIGQLCCGMIYVLFYAQSLFNEIQVISASACAIFFAIVFVLASVVAPLLIEQVGRRVLLFLSGIGMFMSLGLLSVYLYSRESLITKPPLDLVLILCLFSYLISYSVGYATIPPTVMAEIFPSYAKASGIAVCVLIQNILAALLAKYLLYLHLDLGDQILYGIIAVSCALSTILFYFTIPETSNKTFVEIQALIESNQRPYLTY